MNNLFEDKDYNGPNLRSQTGYQLPKINCLIWGKFCTISYYPQRT